MDNEGTLVMRDARLIFRNFSGAEKQYNTEGDRNFCLVLDPDLAERMSNDGWNIKTLKPREDDGDEVAEGTPYIQVTVKYGKGRPPRVVTVTSRGTRDIGEEEVASLDWVDIAKVDLVIRPYDWVLRTGASGRKAYLKSLFVTIDEDELEAEYASL